ncbi:MAG: 50S ribosomal protein L1 [bacterium]
MDEESTHVFKAAPTARTHAERAGKKYKEAYAKVDSKKEYTMREALELATQTSTTKFDSSVELHIRLNVDPRQADQNIRDSIVLPEGTGKTVRVAVFADIEDVAIAKKAGADIAGAEEFLQQLDKGIINFDVLIATPLMMAKLGKYARALGPKGLMPNPKSGTVTKDVAKAVTEAKAGRIEFRVDSTGIVHVAVGKVSFGTARLAKNTAALMSSLKNAKPSSVKGSYVKSIFVASSMGPSIKVITNEI